LTRFQEGALRAALFLLPFVLAACVEGQSPPDPGVAEPAPPIGSCGAGDLQGLVGQPQSVLQTMKFAGPVRIIQPGMAVTMDYSEDRLNILINEAGMIESVTCG
jgi:hypothetical protein